MKITELTERLEKLFASRHLSESTIRQYRTQWRRLRQFCLNNYGDEEFTIDRGMAYFQRSCNLKADKLDFAQPLTPAQVHVLRCVNVLEDYQLHGTVTPSRYTRGKVTTLPEKLSAALLGYKNELADNGLADETRKARLRLATSFLDFLAKKGLVDLTALTLADCDAFMKTWAGYNASSIELFLRCLKYFLRYLKTTSGINEDIAEKLPAPRLPRHSMIPSCWTSEEIGKLLTAIDRNNPQGKRDYAMILLACILGIRCGDIARLRISDFDWHARKLSFIQHKTGKRLELPLPEQVYKALGDYLRNGRPKYYETDVIFLKMHAPIEPFTPNGSGLTSMLERLCRKAEIPTTNRKRGFHSLRHTAACSYLEMETPVPVIAEILGHSDIESTSCYLKTELKKLADCVLEPMEFNDEEE